MLTICKIHFIVLCIVNISLYKNFGSKLSKIQEIIELSITYNQKILTKDGINKQIIPKIILTNNTIVYIKSLIVIKSSNLIIV